MNVLLKYRRCLQPGRNNYDGIDLSDVGTMKNKTMLSLNKRIIRGKR